VSITFALAIYFVLWWVVLFVVLPWGVRSQAESGEVAPGTDPGAPAIHRIGRVVIWTTIISAVIFSVAWAAYAAGLIPFDFVWAVAGPPER
jgi:predicted secreted protein